MATTLPNGLVIFNVTPHPLIFYCGYGKATVTAPSDGIVNARPVSSLFNEEDARYKLRTVTYLPTLEGDVFVKQIQKEYPDALIVGSIIAARAYPGRIVAAVPLKYERGSRNDHRLSRSDRFTIFPQENNNHG